MSCGCSLEVGDIGLHGLGGGRGGKGFWVGFGGGSGGGLTACLVGGIRAILGVGMGGDVGSGLEAGGTGFRMDLGRW